MDNLLESALGALVMQRCRRAYLHDLRDGLQAIRLACELLSRSATAPTPNADALAKAAELVRRSMANCDYTLEQTLQKLLPSPGQAAPLELEALIRDVLRLLQSDADTRGVTFNFVVSHPATVTIHAAWLRLVLTGLAIDGIDTLARGASLQLSLDRFDDTATIEVSGLPGSPRLDTLVLPVARRLVLADGGQLALGQHGASGNNLRISYPVTHS